MIIVCIIFGEIYHKIKYLSIYRKIYADKKKMRIVYKFADETIFVQIIAVGKRESMEVYKNAAKRI